MDTSHFEAHPNSFKTVPGFVPSPPHLSLMQTRRGSGSCSACSELSAPAGSECWPEIIPNQELQGVPRDVLKAWFYPPHPIRPR